MCAYFSEHAKVTGNVNTRTLIIGCTAYEGKADTDGWMMSRNAVAIIFVVSMFSCDLSSPTYAGFISYWQSGGALAIEATRCPIKCLKYAYPWILPKCDSIRVHILLLRNNSASESMISTINRNQSCSLGCVPVFWISLLIMILSSSIRAGRVSKMLNKTGMIFSTSEGGHVSQMAMANVNYINRH
jgi:hypothetical protein